MKSEIIHDKDAIKTKKVRITTLFLTKYEKTRLLGTRALQISLNAPSTVDTKDEYDPLKIAMMELQQRKIPLSVRRFDPLGNLRFYN